MTVRLTWDGRDDGPLEGELEGRLEDCRDGERAPEGALEGQRSLFDDVARTTASSGTLIEGDNLAAMRALAAEGQSFGLAYLDPPYRSGADYQTRTKSGEAGTHAYGDRWDDRESYLSMLWPRLRLAHRLLAPHGTIWVQVDHRASGLVQPLLDELFGAERLRNVIAWRRAPPLGRQVQSKQFPRNLDLLFVYAKGDEARWNPPWTRVPFLEKPRRDERGRPFTLAPRGDYTDESVARLDAEGRIHRSPAGKVYVKYFLEEDPDGTLYKPRAVDAVWDDVAPLRHAPPRERTGYPTQKPEPLLERIISSTSAPGDTVLDPFAGSATTAIVAARLGRRFVVVDESPIAIELAGKRLRDAAVPFTHQRVSGGGQG